MKIYLNNELIDLGSDSVTVEDLVNLQRIPSNGTAIALNNKIVPRSKWAVTRLNESDRVVAISAAFGG